MRPKRSHHPFDSVRLSFTRASSRSSFYPLPPLLELSQEKKNVIGFLAFLAWRRQLQTRDKNRETNTLLDCTIKIKRNQTTHSGTNMLPCIMTCSLRTREASKGARWSTLKTQSSNRRHNGIFRMQEQATKKPHRKQSIAVELELTPHFVV